MKKRLLEGEMEQGERWGKGRGAFLSNLGLGDHEKRLLEG